MTWWLDEWQPGETPAAPPVAARRAPTFGERLSAAATMGRIEDDSWNRSAAIEGAYLEELQGQLGDFLDPEAYKRAKAGSAAGMAGGGLAPNVDYSAEKKVLLPAILAARAADPEKWKGLPKDATALDEEIQRRRRAEYDDAAAVLVAAPQGAWAAEFLGRSWAGLTDEASLATMPVGGVPGAGVKGLLKFMAGEALAGAGAELAIAPRRAEVAEELDLPAPDVMTDVLTAAATSAVFAGGLDLIAKGVAGGVARYADYRAARGEAAATARPGGVTPGAHEAAISAATEAMAQDGPLPTAAPSAPALPPIGPDAPPGWQGIRGGIFAGESGGDWDALFGYSNRPGGRWSDVKLTEMTVDQAIAFSDPAGAYGQWVKEELRRSGQPARVATPMGAYQIVGSTLREAKESLGLTGSELMTPELQERLGQYIYRRQGTGAWEGYRGEAPDFVPGQTGAAAPASSYTRRGYTGRDQLVAGERALDVEHVVVDASLLRPAEGRFQPRDRSRINSDLWIAEKAAKLDPVQLMPARNAAQGAPLIGPDNMIESGNGRFALIQRAYDLHPDRAAAYREAIRAEGFDIPEGMDRPVLVARRLTEVTDDERVQLAVDAQDAGVARMTASELARSGARAMTADALAGLRPDLPLRAPENADFARHGLSGLSASERNALIDADGMVNADGGRRLKQALFARAWDDGGRTAREIIEDYAEVEDTGELKGLMDGLEEAAPDFARLKAEIETGAVRPEFDIAPHVLDALSVIMEARRRNRLKGTPIAETVELMARVPDMFTAPNPLSGALLSKFWRDGRPVPPGAMADFLRRYATEARIAGRADDLLGETSPAAALRAIDPETFDTLPDHIPPVGPERLRPVDAPPMAEAAFAKGADSPEAEAADAEIVAGFREVVERPAIPERLVFSFEEARAVIEALPSREFFNASGGGEITATLSNNNLSKILSSKAVSKSPAPRDQALALANIDSLFAKARYGWTKPDARGEPTIVGLHRYFAPMTLPSGKSVIVKMTVKETKSPKMPNPIYTLEAVETGTDDALLAWLRAARAEDAGARYAPPGVMPSSTDTGVSVGTGSREGPPQRAEPAAARVAGEDGEAVGETIRSAGSVENMAQAADDFNRRAARDEFDAAGDFTLPDGTRASDILADLDEDDTLMAVLDACTLRGTPE